MNYYKQIAERLGVELGEEFKVDNVEGCVFKFTESGLMFSSKPSCKYWNLSCSPTLKSLLSGDYSIVKLPWKPKVGQQYFYCFVPGHAVVSSTWGCVPVDLCYWKAGNCFRTEEEAKTKGKEVMEKLRKEYEEA